MIDYGDDRLPARFWKKVFPEPMSGCWLWAGTRSTNGYGNYSVRPGKWMPAHRVTAELCYGPSSDWVLHSCDIRACVNPAHLRYGDAKDNAADMDRRGRRVSPGSSLTHCKRGHEFTTENTQWVKSGRNRRCKKCVNLIYAAKMASHD